MSLTPAALRRRQQLLEHERELEEHLVSSYPQLRRVASLYGLSRRQMARRIAERGLSERGRPREEYDYESLLERHAGHVTEAAREMGLSRQALESRLLPRNLIVAAAEMRKRARLAALAEK